MIWFLKGCKYAAQMPLLACPLADGAAAVAAGWRRFQSIPVYALEDPNGRQRMLKYTPEHMHCLAVVWGASAPPNTGSSRV